MTSLQSLARSADGNRLLNSKKIDIAVTSFGIGKVVLHAVPKQMLAHFCGWDYISPLLHYTNEGKQELRLKEKHCEVLGLKVVIDWMQRACKDSNIDVIKAPSDDIVLACSIQRALRVLGCYADADRMNRYVKRHFFDQRNVNAPKVAKMLEAFPIDSLHINWLATNVIESLDNEVLPATFRRNLRAVIKKNWAFEVEMQNIRISRDAAGANDDASVEDEDSTWELDEGLAALKLSEDYATAGW